MRTLHKLLIQLHTYFEITRNQTCPERALAYLSEKAPQKNTMRKKKSAQLSVKMKNQRKDCETRRAILLTKGHKVDR